MPLDSQEAARLALREIHRDYGAAGLDDDDLMHRLCRTCSPAPGARPTCWSRRRRRTWRGCSAAGSARG
ncbi:hypothetical protein ACFQX7_38755 [Luedemannella flava]